MNKVECALSKIKSTIPVRDLYSVLNGREGTRVELQILRNRLSHKRGSLTIGFLADCVEKVPEMQGMTLAEFFGINEQKED